MAFHDILQHILEDAEARIATAKNDQRQRLATARVTNERETDAELARIRQTKEAKKIQMRERAESHSIMARRHAVLKKKQELIGKVYEEVLMQMESMPESQLEKFFAACLERVHGEGTVSASAKHEGILKKLIQNSSLKMGEPMKTNGGFIVSTETQNFDFSFPFLVQELLRPRTELEVLRSVLPA